MKKLLTMKKLLNMKSNNNNHKKNKNPDKKMPRREALKKAGKYTALTTASMLMVLSPKAQQQQSAPATPDSW